MPPPEQDFSVRIRRAAMSEMGEVTQLVRGAGLPLEGLTEAAVVLVAEGHGELAGTVALEEHGSGDERAYLLRSAAVAPAWRGRGVGSALTRAALAHVDSRGASVALLTGTADGYFAAFGFHRVERDQVPAALAASPELRGACPVSARAMLRAPASISAV
ncbi:MAG: GNAT family N-acetyltransferase [Candidatus Dormibacteria bacterium]|jgi:amino-acid N-acetyltransferase